LETDDYLKPKNSVLQDENKLQIRVPKSLAQNIKNYNL
jgi:hypothetical protein